MECGAWLFGRGGLKIQARGTALGSHNESHRTRALVSSFFSSHPRLFPNPAPFRPGNRARKAAGPIVLAPSRFQKRLMKPAYRASSMYRKTPTAEIQCGTSNVSTSDLSPLPCSSSKSQPARKTQRFCPMEQSNMAKRAALPSVRLLAYLAEKKGRAHARWWWRPGRSRSMRSALI